MPKKMKKKGKPDLHEDLQHFEFRINELGQVSENSKIDELNHFLNKVMEKDTKNKKSEEE